MLSSGNYKEGRFVPFILSTHEFGHDENSFDEQQKKTKSRKRIREEEAKDMLFYKSRIE